MPVGLRAGRGCGVGTRTADQGRAADRGDGRLRAGGQSIGAVKHRIEGNPDPKYVSTSFAERSNFNVRMHTRRFTRLTNAFSKKVENHAHSVALFAMCYDFVRIHKTLRTAPAMAAGVTSRLWRLVISWTYWRDGREAEDEKNAG